MCLITQSLCKVSFHFSSAVFINFVGGAHPCPHAWTTSVEQLNALCPGQHHWYTCAHFVGRPVVAHILPEVLGSPLEQDGKFRESTTTHLQ